MVIITKGETIWTRVRINDGALEKELQEKPDSVLDYIETKVSAEDLLILGEGIIKATPLTVIKGLEQLHNKNPERMLLIYCLREFMNGKNRPIMEVGKDIIGSDVDMQNELVTLYKLYSKDPILMLEVFIRTQVQRRSFDTYLLQSSRKSRPSIQLSDIDEIKANLLLQDVDKKIGDKKESHCWHVSRVGDTTEMYIRREEDPILMSKLLNNIPEILANSIIIRFDKYGRTVDLWSENDDIACNLLNHIGIKLFGKDTTYNPDVFENEVTDSDSFLNKITSGLDNEITLLRIDCKNSPLKGSPQIKIESKKSILPAIEHLLSFEIDITAEASHHIEGIKIIFKEKKYHLAFRIRNGRVLISLNNQRGPGDKSSEFKKYIKSNYGLRLSMGI